LGQLGLLAQAVALCALLALLWCLLAPLAYGLSGANGLWAAAVGAAATLSGGLVALALISLCQGPQAALASMLLGMMARMVLPLAIGVALTLKVTWLADAGMIFYLLVFYLVTLALETAITLAKVQLPLAPRKTLCTK
jgi:hypothetical protein